jgi:hypothetical protein
MCNWDRPYEYDAKNIYEVMERIERRFPDLELKMNKK